MVIRGDSASVYLDGAKTPVLVGPRLAGVEGTGVGLWAGNLGGGAYFSNFTVYSDGITIYLNSPPQYFGMNPQALRDGLGLTSRIG
jgi:hypothetical protein